MLPINNNLGEDQSGYAFRVENVQLENGIDTCRVTWESEAVTVTADQALAPPQQTEERSAIGDEAALLLITFLLDWSDGSAPLGRERIRLEIVRKTAARRLWTAQSRKWDAARKQFWASTCCQQRLFYFYKGDDDVSETCTCSDRRRLVCFRQRGGVIADTDSSFPKDNSRDYAVPVVVIADAGSPFPKDNSRDYAVPVVVIVDAGSSFPKDNSRDYATPIDGMYLAKPEANGAFPKDNGIDRAIG